MCLNHTSHIQVALFGSRARGNYKQNSDYDVMIWWNKKTFLEINGILTKYLIIGCIV